jgi:periplasmic protein TonB
MNERLLPTQKPPGRALTITLLVSLGLHLAGVVVALLLLRGGTPIVDDPEKIASVELVMEEHKGENHPTAAQTAQSETPAKQQPPEEKQPEANTPAPPAEKPVETPPVPQQATAEPLDQPIQVPAPPEVPKPPREAAPPAPPPMTVTLQGTDSPSDAKAWGDHVLPAAPDAVFHNRPPVYPEESAENGEHGTVILLIHVSPAGRAAGVDVTRSSGFAMLDRAARDAVSRWRFLPAVKDGQPVTSEMEMGFIFGFE